MLHCEWKRSIPAQGSRAQPRISTPPQRLQITSGPSPTQDPKRPTTWTPGRRACSNCGGQHMDWEHPYCLKCRTRIVVRRRLIIWMLCSIGWSRLFARRCCGMHRRLPRSGGRRVTPPAFIHYNNIMASRGRAISGSSSFFPMSDSMLLYSPGLFPSSQGGISAIFPPKSWDIQRLGKSRTAYLRQTLDSQRTNYPPLPFGSIIWGCWQRTPWIFTITNLETNRQDNRHVSNFFTPFGDWDARQQRLIHFWRKNFEFIARNRIPERLTMHPDGEVHGTPGILFYSKQLLGTDAF